MSITIAVPRSFPRNAEEFVVLQACMLVEAEMDFVGQQKNEGAGFLFPYRHCALMEYMIIPLAVPAHYATSGPLLRNLTYQVEVTLRDLRQFNCLLSQAYEQDIPRANRRFIAFNDYFPVYPN